MKKFLITLFGIWFGAVFSASSLEIPVREKGKTMKITIGDKSFNVTLDENRTASEIAKHLPLELDMVEFAGHEYYAELPFVPFFDKERTSHLKAGHIYYWDGWNSFVVNYKEADIAPYKSVHIGAIEGEEASQLLAKSPKNIRLKFSL